MRRQRIASHSPTEWLVIRLFILLTLPTIGILALVVRANRSEHLAARQRLAESYRAELTSAKQRLNERLAVWIGAIEQTASTFETQPALAFAAAVRDQHCDGILLRDAQQRLLYPQLVESTMQVDRSFAAKSSAWRQAEQLEFQQSDFAAATAAYAAILTTATVDVERATAMQARVRCALKAGNDAEALRQLDDWQRTPTLLSACRQDGRWIFGDTALLWLEQHRHGQLTGNDSGDGEQLRATLATHLNDYARMSMPSYQRVFLMTSLLTSENSRAPNNASESPRFDTLNAERLAAKAASQYLAEPAHFAGGSAKLIPTDDPAVWQYSAVRQNCVILFRRSNLSRLLLPDPVDPASIPAEASDGSGTKALPRPFPVALVPPDGGDSNDAFLSLDVGPIMPGWRLRYQAPLEVLERDRLRREQWVVTWITLVAVASLLALGALTTRRVQRRLRLDQLQNDLVDTVAHELRTPLASMRLLADTLRSGQLQEPAQVNEYLDLLVQENHRLSRLVENFLSFSRSRQGHVPRESQSVSIPAAVAASLRAMGPKLATAGDRFVQDLESDLPHVQADIDSLVTVIINLLDNAYKYSSPPRYIELSACRRGHQVAITVADRGSGMSRSTTRQIFQRFYQASRQLNQPHDGCGLGLAIVDKLVKQMNGTITVESELGKGSRFTLCLPIANSTLPSDER